MVQKMFIAHKKICADEKHILIKYIMYMIYYFYFNLNKNCRFSVIMADAQWSIVNGQHRVAEINRASTLIVEFHPEVGLGLRLR